VPQAIVALLIIHTHTHAHTQTRTATHITGNFPSNLSQLVVSLSLKVYLQVIYPLNLPKKVMMNLMSSY